MSKGKILIISIIWCMLIFTAVLLYRWLIIPEQQKQEEQNAVAKKIEVMQKTSAVSKVKNLKTVNIGLDSFAGYAIYRSSVFKDECQKRGIQVNITEDDNSLSRIKKLSSGECDFSLFTIDAFIKASSQVSNRPEDIPGTIIWISDESHGADAVIANSKIFENIDSLNNHEVEIFATESSPSEMLSLVLKDHFNLENAKPVVYLPDVKEVYNQYKSSKPSDKKVFILWEPYISKVLENKDYKILVDSEKFKDYIVDVMVVSRDFVVKNPQIAYSLAESYFTSLFRLRDTFKDELTKDGKKNGFNLTSEQADRMAKSIQLKNTQENYAHFGLIQGYNLQSIESIISEILSLQTRTNNINQDPSQGQINCWYFPGVLNSLNRGDFRPGLEKIQQESVLPALADQEWLKLKPVGSLQAPKIIFRRGSSKISTNSEQTLSELVVKLNKWTAYYLLVKGNASMDGDPVANRILAESRATETKDWLIEHGINSNRVKIADAEPDDSTTVKFILLENPY